MSSTVTYTVKKLEEDLGFAIFKRVGRRSVLTPAGQVLLEQGRKLLVAAQDVVASAHQVNSGWEAELNIAIDTVWDIQPYVAIVIRDSATQSPIRPHRSLGERPMLRVASMEQKIQAQLQAVGVGFLPRHKIQHLLDSGELVALKIEKETPVTQQYCAWRITNTGRATQWFVDRIMAMKDL